MSTFGIQRPLGNPNTYASVASGQIRLPLPEFMNQPPHDNPNFPAHTQPPQTGQHGHLTKNPSPTVPAYLGDTAFTNHLAQLKPSDEDCSPPPTTLSFLGKPPQNRLAPHSAPENKSTNTTTRSCNHLPSRFNELDKASAIEVFPNGLEVRFQGATKSDHEAGTVRADHPVPANCGIYYFEVTVFSRGKEGLIGIGFCEKTVDLQRLPGWEAKSYGYHGDDGKAFGRTGNGQGEAYGPSFSSGDTVGCGINMADNSAFFTKNGRNLGTAFRDLKGTYYPSVGMQKDPEHIKANFGQERFVYDIENHIRAEKLRICEETVFKTPITSISSKLDEPSFIQTVVASYLAHEGYMGTLKALTREYCEDSTQCEETAKYNLAFYADSKALANLSKRQKIRKSILAGNIDEAMRLAEEYYPGLLRENEDIHFRLKCRHLKEMVCRISPSREKKSTNGKAREMFTPDDMEIDELLSEDEIEEMDGSNNEDSSNESLEKAISYTHVLRAEFRVEKHPRWSKALDDAFSLISYVNPKESDLYDEDGRSDLADDLNAAILVSQGRHSMAPLGRLVQQTAVLVDEVSSNGGPASLINVQRDFLSNHGNFSYAT